LNHRLPPARRFAAGAVALAASMLFVAPAHSLGLGRAVVQSSLGEALRAEIDVTSLTPEEAASLRLRIASPEAFRAAGVDFNPALAGASLSLQRRPDGRTVLRVAGDRAVTEPFLDLIVEASWAQGRLVREYTMLFDPPGTRVAAAPAPAPGGVATPAVIGAAPAAGPAAAPAVRAPAAPAALAAAPAAPAAPRPTVAGGDTLRVQAGDSLSRLAAQARPAGVSLDQMLVALYRANPQAFIGQNMNRLRAGAVLTVPAAEAAGRVGAGEARELIQAQSADFEAFRQGLASGVRTAEAPAARQARGRVQAEVKDGRQATPPADQLRLSQGSVAPAPAPAPEPPKDTTASRVAELSRNVEELRRMQQQPPAAAPAPAPAPAPAATPAAPAAPTIVTPGAGLPAPAAPPVAAPAAPLVAPPTAAEPPPVVAAAPAPAPAPTTPPPPPAAAPAPAPAEPGFLGSLLDNPFVLPGAAVLVALLAGLGFYRMRGRMKKTGGETSFLESRLQPDSFFGASGGQRVDTREGGAAPSSSMSYSLSQLDAIGDVDPVAEADVYLAYGRDLQAEEILKEAMRANPDRLAIRTKLLEVYAKRRDTKGFELLATQLFSITRGTGDDWTRVQELGRGIDPSNGLYKPGGKPADVVADEPVPDVLDMTTQPYTAPPPPPQFVPDADATLGGGGGGGVDLDLDLDFGAPPAPVPAPIPPTVRIERPAAQPESPVRTVKLPERNELPAIAAGEPRTMAMPRPDAAPSDFGRADFTLDEEPITQPGALRAAAPNYATTQRDTLGGRAAPAASADTNLLDFDLSQFTPTERIDDIGRGSTMRDPGLDFAATDIDDNPVTLPPDDDDANPLARKLELAEEFRQIGDIEGARDLLEEVVAKADGALRAKAQGMLSALG
jgi:pilus assembly protein FimV